MAQRVRYDAFISYRHTEPDSEISYRGAEDGYEEYRYLVTLPSYEQIIRLADEYLGDFKPDERVKEKYGLE